MDDDGVMVKLLDEDLSLLFCGFLVQDDFSELKVDYDHAIILSANDGMGLLKGVVLSDASVRRAYMVTFITLSPSQLDNLYIFTNDTAFFPAVGSTIEIQGIVYAIEASQPVQIPIGSVMYNWLIRINPDGPMFAQTTEVVYIEGEVNLLNRNSLLTMIAVCLAQTNNPLVTNIFMNLYEYRQDNTISTFEQTLISSQTFIAGDTYMDCYAVLSMILAAFDCSLIQANGQWNIVHWHESKRYTGNAMPGFVYDEGWMPIGTTVFNNNFFINRWITAQPQPPTRYVFPINETFYRGYKFSRKTFNYKTDKYLLRNYDLQDVGPLIRTYINTAGNTVSEYTAIGWLNTFGSPAVERFIRVLVNNLGAEIERYLVLRGDTFDSIRCLPSDPIDCELGDKIRFACSFRGTENVHIAGFAFAIYLSDGTSNLYLNNDLNWSSIFGFDYTYDAGVLMNTWQSIDTEISNSMPISGLMTIFLPQFTGAPQSTSKECHFKDLRFEYVPYVNDSTKVIGQIHTQEQTAAIKQNADVEIPIDDAPRNTLSGCLFLTSVTGVLQDRTLYWRYPPDANRWKLGELTTLEELTWRQKTRSKLEGGFIGNYQTAVISLLTMVITDFNTAKNYVPGLMTIDYKRNQFSCTLWEIYSTEDGEFDPEYLFKYIYSTT